VSCATSGWAVPPCTPLAITDPTLVLIALSQ
jgi:hypothetical protein